MRNGLIGLEVVYNQHLFLS